MGYAFYPVLTTVDAQRIDTKIDDGLPATGAVTTFLPGNSYGGNCPTMNVVNTAQYALATGGIQCALMFIADGF